MKFRLSVSYLLLVSFCVLTLSGIMGPVAQAETTYPPPNTFAGTLIELTNVDRVNGAVGTLVSNPLLTIAAQRKADDMASGGYFSHLSPSGKTPWAWITAVGYGYTHAGENLAVNFTDPQNLEHAWMQSPSHRANIVKSAYTEVGIGIAQGMYLGRPTTFVVEFFATPAKPQVTPFALAPRK